MKRKLIKQGLGGYTVTVPISWVRKHSLDSDREVVVVEEEGKIIISADDIQKQQKEMTLEISNQDEMHIRTALSSAYRRGFDKILLTSSHKIPFVEINSIVDSLLG